MLHIFCKYSCTETVHICTSSLDVFCWCYLGDLKTALQQIKDELTEIKQEMREEHITTRNTSLQGKHAVLENCLMIRIVTAILTHTHMYLRRS